MDNYRYLIKPFNNNKRSKINDNLREQVEYSKKLMVVNKIMGFINVVACIKLLFNCLSRR